MMRFSSSKTSLPKNFTPWIRENTVVHVMKASSIPTTVTTMYLLTVFYMLDVSW